MTVKEALAQIPEDEYVYIGTAGGSGWIYIAKRGELEEKLPDISVDQRGQRETKLKSVTEDLDSMGARIGEQEKIINAQREIIDKALQKINDACARIEYMTGNFEQLRDSQAKLTKYLENWQDISDRDVVEIYPHKDVEPKGTSIRMKGEEAGKYWMLSEIEQDEQGNKPDTIDEVVTQINISGESKKGDKAK